MKTTALAAMVLVLLITGGCQSTKVCQCPPEPILINTEAGILSFEPGEIDQDVSYILRGETLREFMRLYEIEKLKQNGGAS